MAERFSRCWEEERGILRRLEEKIGGKDWKKKLRKNVRFWDCSIRAKNRKKDHSKSVIQITCPVSCHSGCSFSAQPVQGAANQRRVKGAINQKRGQSKVSQRRGQSWASVAAPSILYFIGVCYFQGANLPVVPVILGYFYLLYAHLFCV